MISNYSGIVWKEASPLTKHLFDVIASVAKQSPAFNMQAMVGIASSLSSSQ